MNESRRVRTCVLGTNQALNAGAAYVRSLTDLADGEIAIVNGAGYCYDSGTTVSSTTEKLRFAVRNGSELLYTPFFTQGKVTAATKQAAVHAINQVSYIGYDLSGNSIEVIDSNTYYIRIYRREWDNAGNSADIKYGIYKSDATATQSEIAYGLTDSLIANFKREAHTDILFDRVYSGAVTQYAWASNFLTFAVTKGSAYITADEAFTVTAGIAVGTILNLAGLAFTVTEVVSTTVVKLDIPWQHESGYVLWNDTGAATISVTQYSKYADMSVAAESPFDTVGQVIYLDIAGVFYKAVVAVVATGILTLDQPYAGTTDAAAAMYGGTAAAGGNWGIRCEGQDREFATLTKPYNKVRFDLQILDSGSTTQTLSRQANEGRGMWQQIAQEEWFCQHAEGKRYNNDSAVAQKRALTSQTVIYNTLVIHYYDDTYTGSVNGTVRSDAEIIIAIPEAFGTTTLMDAVDTALAGITFS